MIKKKGVDNMKYCSNCGNKIEEGVSYCPNCGNRTDGKREFVGSKPNIENRNLVTCILLTFITCGIYSIIWFVSMVNDVNRVCDDEKSSQSGGMVLLLTLITCGIYSLIWFYQVGKRLNLAGQKYQMRIDDNSVLYLVLSLIGLQIVSYCLVQNELNQFSE